MGWRVRSERPTSPIRIPRSEPIAIPPRPEGQTLSHSPKVRDFSLFRAQQAQDDNKMMPHRPPLPSRLNEASSFLRDFNKVFEQQKEGEPYYFPSLCDSEVSDSELEIESSPSPEQKQSSPSVKSVDLGDFKYFHEDMGEAGNQ